jgi:hypothetical protein
MDLIRKLLPDTSYLSRSHHIPLLDWVDKVSINLRGRKYSFHKHEYLRDIMEDAHPDQTYEKAAQVGISTSVLIKSLYVAEHLGKKTVYYFQDDGAVSDFSADRAEPMIQSTLYLQGRVGGVNRVGLRRIGPGSLYFRGLFTKGKVKSVDADYIVLDELDEAKPSHIQFATDRLMHSDLQWVTALSQPSIPGFGISKRFQDTDQRFFHLKCPSCGEWNCLELNWQSDPAANFIPIAGRRKKQYPEGATHYRGCKKCQKPLDMKVGKWVAKRPNALKRGYHLSQLYTQIKPPEAPNIATMLWSLYEDKKRSQAGLENFTISVLGFPFSGANARVNDELLDFMEQDYQFAFKGTGCFMGVDQGDVLTIVVGMCSGQYFKILYAEETESWKRLPYLMSQFGVMHCVVDAQPNKNSAKEFAIHHRDRVSIQYFGGKELKKGEELYEGKIVVPTVTADRTETLDGAIDRMEMGLVHLPSRSKATGSALSTIEDIRRHLKQLITKNEEGANGITKKVYLRGNGIENHYGMALNSALISAYGLGFNSPGPMVLPVFRGYGNA